MSNETVLYSSEASSQYTAIQYGGLSDQGKVRKKNEDSFGLFPQQGLFFVADGVGGMPAGDIASMLITQVLPELLLQRIAEPELLTSKELIDRLKQAIIDLSNRIRLQSQNRPEYAGMGSTLALALLTKNKCYIANLGDSRIYLHKNNQLHQLSIDHTLVHHLLTNDLINEEEALHHPGKNQLVQYVGMQRSPIPDVICLPRTAGDQLLLCSDGLTDMLSESEINHYLMKVIPAEKKCQALVKAANLAGGKDNVTVVIVS